MSGAGRVTWPAPERRKDREHHRHYRPSIIVNRQGKYAVLYAGLLDLAHRSGLKSIATKLVQAPAEANTWTAICWAEVSTEAGSTRASAMPTLRTSGAWWPCTQSAWPRRARRPARCETA